MRDAGPQSKHPKPYKRTTMPDRFAPRLANRNWSPGAPDRLWVGDITYIKTWTGGAYLLVLWNPNMCGA